MMVFSDNALHSERGSVAIAIAIQIQIQIQVHS